MANFIEIETGTSTKANSFKSSAAVKDLLSKFENEAALTAETIDLGISAQTVPTAECEIIADKYLVLEKLGTGGMSTVYKVKHLHLNKIFALKILHHHTKSESVLRFQQEAKASTMLQHPNIVRVHDFGISREQPYMIMDYVEGVRLSDLLKDSGPITGTRVTRIFGQICSALAHAHEQGVVHRDIKPSNIIIQNYNTPAETAVVVDFGIAKIIARDCSNLSRDLTRTGDIFGTPLYMSPEQCQGQAVDAGSDIYSLSCVMYEAVTGNTPFQSNSVYELIHQHVTEAPPPFPECLRKSKLGRRLEALILKGMAKSPADRPRYMLEIASELKSIEIGDGGIWSDLVSIFQIASGRLKAAERKMVITRSALQLASATAVLISILLFALPGQIEANELESNRNAEIIKLINGIFAKRHSMDFKMWEESWLPGTLDNLIALTKADKKQEEAARRLCEVTMRAAISSARVARVAEYSLSSNSISIETFRVLQCKLSRSLRKWCDANRYSSELLTMALAEVEKARQSIQISQAILQICRFAAVPLALLLSVLLIRRYGDLKRLCQSKMDIEAAG